MKKRKKKVKKPKKTGIDESDEVNEEKSPAKIPVFKVDKFPFFYKQWRISVGVAWRI
jgi:hypothetical protein